MISVTTQTNKTAAANKASQAGFADTADGKSNGGADVVVSQGEEEYQEEIQDGAHAPDIA